MDAFDVVVDASYTKILKPDPRAYRLLLEAIDLPAESCVFLDDQQRNIEGARAIGMRAVHFDVRDARASYNTALTMLGLPIVL
jgi:putative hydrolase of the HAD superfamily